jgi:hypothetical protein
MEPGVKSLTQRVLLQLNPILSQPGTDVKSQESSLRVREDQEDIFVKA